MKVIQQLKSLNEEGRVDCEVKQDDKTKTVGQFIYVSDVIGVFQKEGRRTVIGKYIYKMNKSVLEAVSYGDTGKDLDDSKFRPVVPDLLQPLVLKMFHEGLAHPGRNRTLETIHLNG